MQDPQKRARVLTIACESSARHVRLAEQQRRCAKISHKAIILMQVSLHWAEALVSDVSCMAEVQPAPTS